MSQQIVNRKLQLDKIVAGLNLPQQTVQHDQQIMFHIM